MKYAEFKRYEYQDDKRQVYEIWLRLYEPGQFEWFHGPISTYRPFGWERATTQLIIDAMRIAFTLIGFEVYGDA